MLTRTLLTSLKATCCAPAFFEIRSVRRASSTALATLGACFILGGAADLTVANAPEKTRLFTTQRQESQRETAPTVSTQPAYLQRLPRDSSPSQTESDEIERELTQLEFQFLEAQKIGSERLNQLTAQIAVLLDSARRLATQPDADSQLAKRAATLVAQLETFQRFIDDSSVFFQRLAQLDAASLNAEKTRSFFASFLAERAPNASLKPYFSEVSNSSVSIETPSSLDVASSFDAYQTELRRVAASLDALKTLETWNAFVESNGPALERFYVDAQTAENALNFIAQTENQQGLPKEFQILRQRVDEWRFTSLNRVAIQRKILLALEAELALKYWTFSPAPNKIYYLQQPPRPGRNVYFANAQGALDVVDVPKDAPETKSTESTQLIFLQTLALEARLIPERMRADDAARWYAAWSAFLSRLQTTDRLDPLVQFRLLHSVVSTLSSGDFYFERRLAPTRRMLNVPSLVGDDAFDIFQTENLKTQDLRRLAKTRVAFLPTDRLTVDKTTAQLDSQMERFSFVYRQIGWLDRDFSNAWRCRRPENAPLPNGDLYVLLLDAPDATAELSPSDVQDSSTFPTFAVASSQSRPRWRWLKIGASDGRQVTLEFAAPNVCRGSIVLCRSRVGASASAAERDALERILRR